MIRSHTLSSPFTINEAAMVEAGADGAQGDQGTERFTPSAWVSPFPPVMLQQGKTSLFHGCGTLRGSGRKTTDHSFPQFATDTYRMHPDTSQEECTVALNNYNNQNKHATVKSTYAFC